MSGNTPSNDDEAPSSQTPQEESGAIALQNEADANLDLLQAAVKSGLNGYIYLLLVRRITRPSTPIPSEISVDQLSTQQILDLRRIREHDIREADLLTNLRECYTRHYRRLAEGEQALRSAKGIVDPGFWELMKGHIQEHHGFSRSLPARIHRLRRIHENS
ncbi:hypothetical protein M438DRAFT_407714 [Aureobasidium pullulans EXF-150]|uniref:Uncharacterized protein n=1 Tax=Aureobasidium pullulans EXF-150 TaxID=1043002 RepID=A0A074Y455_AURPU|nr:uncharacterized protein M438DRAFT_407714 [Aureobasidium pullulans EXF-150]KEQ81661.1 hypothetical protein M438DRAFT_407714 [Aureobasidium pullulans EXF-150]